MGRVVVTGGAGFLGEPLLRVLAERGARPENILAQFLLEAVILSLVGGLVGSVATSQNERCHKWTYLLALAYLLALLMAWVLPQSLGGTSLLDLVAGGREMSQTFQVRGDPAQIREKFACLLVMGPGVDDQYSVAANNGADVQVQSLVALGEDAVTVLDPVVGAGHG